jgi:hypothetical protein
VRRLALRGRVEGTQGRGRRHALACPGLAPCALWRGMGAFWAPLGAPMPACARVVLVKGVHGRVQGGERELPDMVVHAGIDQVRRWHEVDMPCHGMARFG